MVMDAKTAIEIIRDCGIGKQTAADDCYDFTEEIADFIQQQVKDADIGRAAMRALELDSTSLGVSIDDVDGLCYPQPDANAVDDQCNEPNCPWFEFCRLRAERGEIKC